MNDDIRDDIIAMCGAPDLHRLESESAWKSDSRAMREDAVACVWRLVADDVNRHVRRVLWREEDLRRYARSVGFL